MARNSPFLEGSSPSKSMRPKADEALKLGINGEYFLGIDHLRKLLTQHDIEINKLRIDFGKGFEPPNLKSKQKQPVAEENGDQLMANFLIKVSTELNKACEIVREKSGEKIEFINSEQQLLSLITSVKNEVSSENEASLSETLVEFWESLKFAVERIQSLGDKFNTSVLHRMKNNCLSFGTALGAHTSLSDKYTNEIIKFIDRAETVWKNLRLLAACYPNGIRPGLFDDTHYITELSKSIDLKKFPLLKVVPDLCEKLALLSQVAREWLDRDETYVIDLNRTIREKRGESQDKRKRIREEKEKQITLLKTLKSAQLLCQNSRRQLKQINEDLKDLQTDAKQV